VLVNPSSSKKETTMKQKILFIITVFLLLFSTPVSADYPNSVNDATSGWLRSASSERPTGTGDETPPVLPRGPQAGPVGESLTCILLGSVAYCLYLRKKKTKQNPSY
jgi:hypothetical protein